MDRGMVPYTIMMIQEIYSLSNPWLESKHANHPPPSAHTHKSLKFKRLLYLWRAGAALPRLEAMGRSCQGGWFYEFIGFMRGLVGE